MRSWLNRRLITPLLSFLKQGATVKGLSWALALGIVFGLFPIPGSTTVLCILVAWVGGYNIAVMQLVNYLIYPLQLLLILPMMALGSSMLGLEMTLFSFSTMMELFKEDFWYALSMLWMFQLAGILAWCVCVLPLSLVLYYSFKQLLRRVSLPS